MGHPCRTATITRWVDLRGWRFSGWWRVRFPRWRPRTASRWRPSLTLGPTRPNKATPRLQRTLIARLALPAVIRPSASPARRLHVLVRVLRAPASRSALLMGLRWGRVSAACRRRCRQVPAVAAGRHARRSRAAKSLPFTITTGPRCIFAGGPRTIAVGRSSALEHVRMAFASNERG